MSMSPQAFGKIRFLQKNVLSCARSASDILAKVSNYPEIEVAGRGIVQGYGGQVLVPVTSVPKRNSRIRGE
jgi:hypothetical protein